MSDCEHFWSANKGTQECLLCHATRPAQSSLAPATCSAAAVDGDKAWLKQVLEDAKAAKESWPDWAKNPSDMGIPISQKLEKCISALEFIAFNNHPCWKDRDRRYRALQTLMEIGTHVRVKPPNAPDQRPGATTI